MLGLKNYIKQQDIPNYEFMVIKPGFTHLVGKILEILTKNGFLVIKQVERQLTIDAAKKLYISHKNEDFYKDLCKYMSSGPSIGLLLSNTKHKDLSKIKDEIREKYGEDEMRNCVHSSDSKESQTNVTRESKIYFAF